MTLLVNEEETRRFVQEFLVPYGKPRLLHCMARRKYADDQQLSKPRIYLEKTLIDFDQPERGEDKLIRELRKMEILGEAGLYTDAGHEKNQPLQSHWMVVYVTAYPLDEDEAIDGFMMEVLEKRKNQRRLLASGKPVQDENAYSTKGPLREMTKWLHKSPCRIHRLLKLDIDTKDSDKLQQLYTAMKDTRVVVAAETRGGYHVVVERGKACQNLWKFAQQAHAGISKQDHWITIEDGSGPMFAVPGTNQGGFTVRLVTREWQQATAHAKKSVAEQQESPKTVK